MSTCSTPASFVNFYKSPGVFLDPWRLVIFCYFAFRHASGVFVGFGKCCMVLDVSGLGCTKKQKKPKKTQKNPKRTADRARPQNKRFETIKPARTYKPPLIPTDRAKTNVLDYAGHCTASGGGRVWGAPPAECGRTGEDPGRSQPIKGAWGGYHAPLERREHTSSGRMAGRWRRHRCDRADATEPAGDASCTPGRERARDGEGEGEGRRGCQQPASNTTIYDTITSRKQHNNNTM